MHIPSCSRVNSQADKHSQDYMGSMSDQSQVLTTSQSAYRFETYGQCSQTINHMTCVGRHYKLTRTVGQSRSSGKTTLIPKSLSNRHLVNSRNALGSLKLIYDCPLGWYPTLASERSKGIMSMVMMSQAYFEMEDGLLQWFEGVVFFSKFFKIWRIGVIWIDDRRIWI